MRQLALFFSIGLGLLACSGGSSPGGTSGGGASSGGSSGGLSCGAANFDVGCGEASCPGNSTCVPPGDCHCNEGFLAANCAGVLCDDPTAGCNGNLQNYWCAPRAPGSCGLLNFSVQCSDAGIYCPANSACVAGCVCDEGYIALSCAGIPCQVIDGGCDGATGDYWCAPRDAGGCGPANFTVACDTLGSYCPSNGSCVGNKCLCNGSFTAMTCGGQPCDSSDGGCNSAAGNWWCAP